MKRHITTLICFLALIPGFVLAAPASTPIPAPTKPGTPAPTPIPPPTNSSVKGDLSYSLQNPLAFDSIQGFIVAILNIIIVIATPIVVIFIILAGFKYVTARGDVSKVQEATRALTYSVIGGVLIIGAVAIAEIIKNLVTAFGN
ncbi:MAG: hypothetical protein AAB618_04015 [Patescibacteria group bacterium]